MLILTLLSLSFLHYTTLHSCSIKSNTSAIQHKVSAKDGIERIHIARESTAASLTDVDATRAISIRVQRQYYDKGREVFDNTGDRFERVCDVNGHDLYTLMKSGTRVMHAHTAMKINARGFQDYHDHGETARAIDIMAHGLFPHWVRNALSLSSLSLFFLIIAITAIVVVACILTAFLSSFYSYNHHISAFSHYPTILTILTIHHHHSRSTTSAVN